MLIGLELIGPVRSVVLPLLRRLETNGESPLFVSFLPDSGLVLMLPPTLPAGRADLVEGVKVRLSFLGCFVSKLCLYRSLRSCRLLTPVFLGGAFVVTPPAEPVLVRVGCPFVPNDPVLIGLPRPGCFPPPVLLVGLCPGVSLEEDPELGGDLTVRDPDWNERGLIGCPRLLGFRDEEEFPVWPP